MRLARVCVVACMALLTGCASSTLTNEHVARLRSVGVVSLLNPKTPIQKIGFTVFNNERATRPLGAALNQAVETALMEAMKQARPAWDVRRVASDRSALLEAAYRWNPLLSSEAARARTELTDAMRRERLDGAVVVTENIEGDRFDSGVGILMRATDEITSVRAHGRLWVTVMDAKGEILAERYSVAHEFLPEPQKYDYRLDKNLTDTTMDAFRAALQRVVIKQVTGNVKQLGF